MPDSFLARGALGRSGPGQMLAGGGGSSRNRPARSGVAPGRRDPGGGDRARRARNGCHEPSSRAAGTTAPRGPRRSPRALFRQRPGRERPRAQLQPRGGPGASRSAVDLARSRGTARCAGGARAGSRGWLWGGSAGVQHPRGLTVFPLAAAGFVSCSWRGSRARSRRDEPGRGPDDGREAPPGGAARERGAAAATQQRSPGRGRRGGGREAATRRASCGDGACWRWPWDLPCSWRPTGARAPTPV